MSPQEREREREKVSPRETWTDGLYLNMCGGREHICQPRVFNYSHRVGCRVCKTLCMWHLAFIQTECLPRERKHSRLWLNPLSPRACARLFCLLRLAFILLSRPNCRLMASNLSQKHFGSKLLRLKKVLFLTHILSARYRFTEKRHKIIFKNYYYCSALN
jgi:hypothetical protein